MSMTRRLRYTGAGRQTFTENGVGEVENGDLFDVPAEEAERYLWRGDIEEATPKPGRKPKADANASQDGDTNGASLSGDGDASGSPTGNGGTEEQQVP
jgi:hypothetical protein